MLAAIISHAATASTCRRPYWPHRASAASRPRCRRARRPTAGEHRGALARTGRELRHERRLRRFQDVEAEEVDERTAATIRMVCGALPSSNWPIRIARMPPSSTGFILPVFRDDDRRDHHHEQATSPAGRPSSARRPAGRRRRAGAARRGTAPSASRAAPARRSSAQQLDVVQHLGERRGHVHGLGRIGHDPTTPIARIDSTPTIANSPLIPTQWNTIGAPTIATANDTPIEPPTIAIAFVRFCSEVRSAMNASTADDTAPIPGSRGRR